MSEEYQQIFRIRIMTGEGLQEMDYVYGDPLPIIETPGHEIIYVYWNEGLFDEEKYRKAGYSLKGKYVLVTYPPDFCSLGCQTFFIDGRNEREKGPEVNFPVLADI